MRYLRTLLATASLSAAAAAAPGHATPEDAVKAYFAGSDQCQSKTMRTAFEPDAHLQWVDDAGAPQTLSQLSWWQKIDAAKPCTRAVSRELKILDREGPLALIEATSRFPSFRFHDLLLVNQTPTGWLIVDKVFERLGPDEAPAARAGDDAAIRKVVADKIEAHNAYDPTLLFSSHLPECSYTKVFVEGGPWSRGSLSAGAVAYAAKQDQGITDRVSTWRVLQVAPAGRIAAVKLDVIYQGIRYLDHLLLLRTAAGWRIAAAAWGDPRSGKKD